MGGVVSMVGKFISFNFDENGNMMMKFFTKMYLKLSAEESVNQFILFGRRVFLKSTSRAAHLTRTQTSDEFILDFSVCEDFFFSILWALISNQF